MIIIHIKLSKIEKINCRTAYNPTMADQPDELMDLTNLSLSSRSNEYIIYSRRRKTLSSMFSYEVIENSQAKSRQLLSNVGYLSHSLSIMCRCQLDEHSGNRLSRL